MVEKKKRSKEEVVRMVFDMRQLKRKGMTNVEIAQMYDLNESTVRRHLAKPLTAMESLINTMIRAAESGQDHILREVVNSQDFLSVFGFDYGAGYFLKSSNSEIFVAFEEDVKTKQVDRMKFRIEFEVEKVTDNR